MVMPAQLAALVMEEEEARADTAAKGHLGHRRRLFAQATATYTAARVVAAGRVDVAGRLRTAAARAAVRLACTSRKPTPVLTNAPSSRAMAAMVAPAAPVERAELEEREPLGAQ